MNSEGLSFPGDDRKLDIFSSAGVCDYSSASLAESMVFHFRLGAGEFSFAFLMECILPHEQPNHYLSGRKMGSMHEDWKNGESRLVCTFVNKMAQNIWKIWSMESINIHMCCEVPSRGVRFVLGDGPW
jgi:hypothetical protein